MAHGQQARATGAVVRVPTCFQRLCTSIDFYVVKNLPSKGIIVAPAPQALRGRLDFELQQVILFAGDKKPTLSFEYTSTEGPRYGDPETDSEESTSHCDAALDKDEDTEVESIVAYSGDLRPSNKNSPASHPLDRSRKF